MNEFDQMCMAARHAFDAADGNDVTTAVFGTAGIRVVLHKSESIGASLHLEITVGNRVQNANISRGSAAYLIAAALIEAADAMSECNRRIREASEAAPENYMPPPLSKPEERLESAVPPGATLYRQVDGDGQWRTIDELISDGVLKPNGPAVHVDRKIAWQEDVQGDTVWMYLTQDPPLKVDGQPRVKLSWGSTAEEATRFGTAGRKGH